MPLFWRSTGESSTGSVSPLNQISPRVCGCAPASAFSSVDLPAPFSPSRAWISPAPTVSWALLNAQTPEKLFARSVTFSKGCDIGLLLL